MFVTLPSPHPGALACPSTPKVLQAKEHAPSFHSFVVFALDSHLSPSRILEARHTKLRNTTLPPNHVQVVFLQVGPLKVLFVSTQAWSLAPSHPSASHSNMQSMVDYLCSMSLAQHTSNKLWNFDYDHIPIHNVLFLSLSFNGNILVEVPPLSKINPWSLWEKRVFCN